MGLSVLPQIMLSHLMFYARLSSTDCVGMHTDANLDRISGFYHEALGGKYVPCAVLFDLGPGVIGVVTLSRRSASSSARETS